MWVVCTRDCVAVAVDRVNSSTRVSATAAEAPLPCSPSPLLLFPKSVGPERQATISAPPRTAATPGRSSPGRQALVTWIGAAGIVPRRKPSCLSWSGSAWLVGLVRSWWIEWFLEEELFGVFWKLLELESLDRFSFV